jgi:hypothetical protein
LCGSRCRPQAPDPRVMAPRRLGATGRRRRGHAVLDRVPRPVRLDLFAPRVVVDAGRYGVAVALIAARHTARGPQPCVPLMRLCGSRGCRGRDKHHDQSDQRKHFLIPKCEHRNRAGAKTCGSSNDHGYADAVRRPVVPSGIARPKASSGQAPWAVLLSALAGGLEALPPRPDEPLDKRRHRLPRKRQQQVRR